MYLYYRYMKRSSKPENINKAQQQGSPTPTFDQQISDIAINGQSTLSTAQML
jgi:hypothetical protein